MKLIIKAKAILSEKDRKKMLSELAEMAGRGVLLLDDKYEYPPAFADDDIQIIVKTKIKKPTAGEHFNYNGIEFVALGEEQGGLLAVVAHELDKEYAFDKDNCNDWRKSTLRRYLNEEYIKNFDKADLLPLVSDLTTDSGQKDYGTSEDYIALLSCDLYRKYRETMPKYDTWVWTLTPWHISPSNANIARVVYTDGSLYSRGAYYSKCPLTASGSTLPRQQSLLPLLQKYLAEPGRNTARSYGTLPSKRAFRLILLFQLRPTIRRGNKWECMKQSKSYAP